MLSSFVDGADKSGTSIPSFSPPAGDETLVLAAKNGNEQAFEILVERHRRKVFVVALHFTRVREDAEDIAQQSFQKAFVHLRRFEGKSSFLTWLTRITVNEALMLLRRARRHREVSIDEDTLDSHGAASPLEIPDSNPNPEAMYLQREEARILSAAMGKLGPGHRKAIELRDLGELSNEETARRMGLSISASKSTVSRGRRKLREAIKGYVRSPRMPRGNCPRSHARPARSPYPYSAWLGRREGGPYGDGSVDRRIGDPCASLLHRP
jgi:RNA polymerase sigma-70 factor (ECF subfamily)